MPDPVQEPQTGAGGTSAPNPGSGGQPAAAGAEPTADATKSQQQLPQFVTPTVLQSVLERVKRQQSEELGKLRQEITSALGDSLGEKIAKALEAHSEKARQPKDQTKEDPHAMEIAKLRSDLDSERKAAAELRTNLEGAQKKEREYRIRNKTVGALSKYECLRSDLVYLGLKDQLHLGEDGETVFAIVKDDYGGDLQIALEDFVRTKVRDDLYPEVFKGSTRAGAQAGGDNGTGGARWKFTKEQMLDPEFYRQNADAIDVALRAGQVKGVPAPAAVAR